MYNEYVFGCNETYNVRKYINCMKVARDYIQGSSTEIKPVYCESYVQIDMDYMSSLCTKESKVTYLVIELCSSLIGYRVKTRVRDCVIKNVVLVDEVWNKFGVNKDDVFEEFYNMNGEIGYKFGWIPDPWDDKAVIVYWKEYGWEVNGGCKEFEIHHNVDGSVNRLSRREHNMKHYCDGWGSK